MGREENDFQGDNTHLHIELNMYFFPCGFTEI